MAQPPALRGQTGGASRTLAEGLADATVAVYRHHEQLLIAWLARQLRSGVSGPDWAAAKLAAIARIRSYAENVIANLDGEMQHAVEQAIALAYRRGGNSALEELGRLSGATERDLANIREALPGAEAINRLIFAAVSTLRGTHLRVLRWSLDAYRAAVGAGASTVLSGTATRLRAAQVAWEDLLSRGITGFTDRAGRRWDLASYVEMAMRTTTAQAAVEGHLDRLAAAGIDLVIVSNAPQECVRCRPWEGKVLARTGAAGTRRVEHATRDRQMVTVHVAGTLAQAIAGGLLHPNCRHSLNAYLPGVTSVSTHTADREGDEARQELRRLERKVREWKLREVGALTPEARSAAAAKVRAYQARIRAHVEATGLHRQRHREQVGQAR